MNNVAGCSRYSRRHCTWAAAIAPSTTQWSNNEDRRLDARVRAEVDEVASGMTVRFFAADAAAEMAVRELMQPFALSFSLVRGE
jgi:hypothetical protein